MPRIGTFLAQQSYQYPNIRVGLYQNDDQVYIRQFNSDALSQGVKGLCVAAARYGWGEGTNWERWRNNTEVTVLASAARTTTTNSADQTNYNARGVVLTIDVTAIVDTPSVTPQIEAKLGSKYEAILTAAAAITAVGVHTYVVYPGGIAARDDVVEVAQLPLPRTWRLTVTHGDADSITYSAEAAYIL